MRTIVVGDLHGKLEIAHEVLSWDMPTVFVGDYLDSFDRTDIDQYLTLELVLDAIESRDNVVGLLGNHEMSYLDPRMRCSGYSDVKQAKISADYRTRMERLLVPYVWKEGFLISHAGVSQYLLTALGDITLGEYLDRGDFTQIGSVRGGYSPCGGLYWCDWRYEFEPVKGVSQIVGHTRGKEVRSIGNNHCIDTLEEPTPTVVIVDDGEVAERVRVGEKE